MTTESFLFLFDISSWNCYQDALREKGKMTAVINTYEGNGGDPQPISFMSVDSGRPLRLTWLEGNMVPGMA